MINICVKQHINLYWEAWIKNNPAEKWIGIDKQDCVDLLLERKNILDNKYEIILEGENND